MLDQVLEVALGAGTVSLIACLRFARWAVQRQDKLDGKRDASGDERALLLAARTHWAKIGSDGESTDIRTQAKDRIKQIDKRLIEMEIE